MEIAAGGYIAFVDSDDYIESNMYYVLIENAAVYDADVVVCGYFEDSFSDNSTKGTSLSGELRVLDSEEALRQFAMCKINFGPWNKFYKRECVLDIKFIEGLNYAEDNLYIYEALKRSNKVVIVEDILYHYVLYDESLSRGTLKEANFLAYDKVYSFVLKDLKKKYIEDDIAVVVWESMTLTYLLNLIVAASVFEEFHEKFIYLRRELLSYKEDLKSLELKNRFTKKQRVKIFLLMYCPGVFKLLIKLNAIRRHATVNA